MWICVRLAYQACRRYGVQEAANRSKRSKTEPESDVLQQPEGNTIKRKTACNWRLSFFLCDSCYTDRCQKRKAPDYKPYCCVCGHWVGSFRSCSKNATTALCSSSVMRILRCDLPRLMGLRPELGLLPPDAMLCLLVYLM